jgi:sulfatase modifying factor 1
MGRTRIMTALAGLAVGAPLAGAMARADPRHTPTTSPASPCPEEMALVEGSFCPHVEQRCLHWMDPPGKYHEYRCAQYARPASCLAPRVHRRFCIDRGERSEPATGLPLHVQSWTDAKQACEAAGARVCLDSEWTFACEGEQMRPYPYGWSREARTCNADRVDLFVLGDRSRLRDARERSGAHPSCTSPFGVLDMAGNVAEWVSLDGHPDGSVVVQKGNWWQPGKEACRDEQAGHDRFYKGTETGFRCCAQAR